MYRIGEDLDALASSLPLSNIHRNPDSNRTPDPASVQPSATRLEDNQCRICFDNNTTENPFITPCRCAGSVKFVHEECLKTWILSQETDLSTSECEVCKVKYKMKFVIKTKCDPNEACKMHCSRALSLPLLVVVLSVLILVIYILSYRLATESTNESVQGYSAAIIIICLASGVVVVLLIYNAIKSSMCLSKLASWTILSQQFNEGSISTEAALNEEHSVNLSESTMQYNDRSLRSELSLVTHRLRPNPGIVVVPEITRVRGQRVLTPTLSPNLPSVQSANPRVQVFIFAESRSVSGSSTPQHVSFPNSSSVKSFEALKDQSNSEVRAFRDNY